MYSANSRYFLYLIFPVLLLAGCDDKSDTIINSNTIHGSGKIVSQVRTVSDCEGITIKSYGNVFLTQDNNQSIRIEADDNIICQRY